MTTITAPVPNRSAKGAASLFAQNYHDVCDEDSANFSVFDIAKVNNASNRRPLFFSHDFTLACMNDGDYWGHTGAEAEDKKKRELSDFIEREEVAVAIAKRGASSHHAASDDKPQRSHKAQTGAHSTAQANIARTAGHAHSQSGSASVSHSVRHNAGGLGSSFTSAVAGATDAAVSTTRHAGGELIEATYGHEARLIARSALKGDAAGVQHHTANYVEQNYGRDTRLDIRHAYNNASKGHVVDAAVDVGKAGYHAGKHALTSAVSTVGGWFGYGK